MLLVTVMAAGLFAGCSSSDDMGGEDVIKVNDTVLTKNYVDARVDQIFQQNQLESDDSYAGYYKSQIITGLVESELMVQEAKNRGIEVSEDDINSYKQDLINQAYGGSEEDFQAYLDEYNVSEDMLARMIEEKLYYDQLLEELSKDVTVDAEAYYNENTDQFYVEDQVDAKHILVADEDTAKDIIKQLDEGADFSELAKEYSTDTATAQDGGELGYFTAAQMVTEFSDAAFALEVGKYTEEPVQTTYGYHVILCEDKKEAHQQTFDEVKDDLTEQLTSQEVQTKYYELVDQLKEDATIEYLSDDYNPDKLIEEAEAQMAEESQAASASSEETAESTETSEDAADTSADEEASSSTSESLVDEGE